MSRYQRTERIEPMRIKSVICAQCGWQFMGTVCAICKRSIFEIEDMRREIMGQIKLNYAVAENPDFGGFRFYIEEGRLFDVDDYCEAYKLRRDSIDDDSIKSIQDAASRLMPGQWLEVSH